MRVFGTRKWRIELVFRHYHLKSMGAILQPKFPEISVQNSMDRFGPTGKVPKKRVLLLRWTTFPCRTGWNFGWMDRAPCSFKIKGICPTSNSLTNALNPSISLGERSHLSNQVVQKSHETSLTWHFRFKFPTPRGQRRHSPLLWVQMMVKCPGFAWGGRCRIFLPGSITSSSRKAAPAPLD